MTRLGRITMHALLLATMIAGATSALFAQVPAITVTPQTLNFERVRGGAFGIASFTITNTGEATLSGNVEAPGGVFQILEGEGEFSLEPGMFQVVTLRFTPSAVKEFTDSIVITHNASASTSPLYVSVAGTGVEAAAGTADTVEISVSPMSLEYGTVRIGQSASRTITVTNTSDSAQLIGTVGVSTGPFVVESGMGAFSLAPGESRPVSIRFVPTMAQSYSDSLVIVYSGTDVVNTIAVQLTGTGSPLSINVPSVSVTPEAAFFGNVRVGESGVRLVTVTNTSDSLPLTGMITGTAAGSSFSVDANGTGSFTLAPGETRAIAVTFTPTSAGVQRDSLAINYGGLLAPTSVQLYGNGIVVTPAGGQEQVITVTPSTIDFGSTLVGASIQRQFTITNPSTTETLNGTLANPAAPFYVQGGGTGAFTLAPGESRTVTVNYTPTFAGTFSDNLMLNYQSGTNIGTSPIRLSGNASVLVSSVHDESSMSMHAITSYPEPTLDAATLRYSTSSNGHVRLAVFDARGREVARLVDAARESGEHVARWDASGQPAGVYVVRMITEDGVSAGRITVVR